MIDVPRESDDAADFVVVVEAVARGLCRIYSPKEFFLLRIDNWFDAKWLKFSGKILGAAGVAMAVLTLPPFVPNRVCWQRRYLPGPTSLNYKLVDPGPCLHKSQRSVANLQRRVSDLVPGAGIMWYSSNSLENSRGAIMAYVPIDGDHWIWYAEMRASEEWRAHRLKGIAAKELQHIQTSTE